MRDMRSDGRNIKSLFITNITVRYNSITAPYGENKNPAPFAAVATKRNLTPLPYDLRKCRSISFNEDGSSAIASTKPTIKNLPGEILMIIFQFLSPIDRIQIERVCKRWKSIAENWINFKQLFARSGRFIQEFSPANFNQSGLDETYGIGDLLPMLPRLQHLNLMNMLLLATDLDLISQKRLKSLVLPAVETSLLPYLTALLQQSDQLEFLRIESCIGYTFDYLPASLKSIEIDYSDYCDELVSQVGKQGIPLVNLKLRNNNIGALGFQQLSSSCSTSLTNLAVYLTETESAQFISLLHTFYNLRVLEVQFAAINIEHTVNEVMLEIVAACPKLEKLSVKFPLCATPDSQTLLKLAELRLLTSVDMCHFCSCRADVDLLLEKLCSNRTLKYFYVDYELPSSLTNRVIKSSKGLLTHPRSTQQTLLMDKSQFEALTRFHGSELLPINIRDRRLHQLWFGYRKQDFPSHPWAILN
uniref:F-box domain-containing protein n=1 Tax=Ditylenchus dipsaci TaxID=166011 RepID=A0A915EV66_9BILA